MEIRGTPWNPHGVPWKFYGGPRTVPRLAADSHGVPRQLHGTPWDSMAFHGVLWKEGSYLPWRTMGFHGLPWFSMVFRAHGKSRLFSTIFHGNFRGNSRGVFHGCPWKIPWSPMVFQYSLYHPQEIDYFPSIFTEELRGVGTAGCLQAAKKKSNGRGYYIIPSPLCF